MAKRIVFLTIAMLFLLPGAVYPADEEGTTWKETTRDVWVDGRLDRGAVVLRATDPPRLALFATRTASAALVVDLDALTVERMAMAAPVLGEKGWESTATGKARAAKGAGVARVDTSTWLLTLPDRSVVIASHDGAPGPIGPDEIFATVPSWEALYQRYEPGADEVAALAGYEGELQLTLAGEPLLHPGRWEREERIAAGRYSHRDATGRESGGTLLHAWSDLDGRLTDVWHRRDEAGQSAFVEITRTRGDWHSRTRHSVRDSVLNATTRGNGTGNIRQTVPFDPGTVLVTPAVVDVGRDWALGGKPAQSTAETALVLGGAGDSAAARPTRLAVTYRGRESLSTPAGPFNADRIAFRLDDARSEWWLDPALGLPIRGRDAVGNEVVLTRLERTPAAAAAPSTADHDH